MRLGIYFKLLFAFLAFATGVQANGGGYSFGIDHTGQVLAFDIEGVSSVQMVEEELNIHLLPEVAEVKVSYRLVNEGKKKKIRFGFPVELQAPLWGFGPEQKITDNSVSPPGVDGYRVFLDGQELGVTWVVQEQQVDSVASKIKGLAGWLVSEASFAAKSELNLKISYQVEHGGSSSSISDDSHESAKIFQYRFSTGGVWKGPIKKGLVSITIAEGLNQNLMEFKKPVNRFQKTQSGWTWAFEDFEPTLADDLKIAVTPDIEYRSNYNGRENGVEGYLKRGELWSAEHSGYDVEVSSTLSKQDGNSYEAENLKRWREDSSKIVWAEGAEGQGVGEWVLLKLKKPNRLTGLRIAGGFQDYDRKELFKANARPKVIEMVLNDEYRQKLYFEDKSKFNTFWVDGYEKPVRTCKLVIKEVYPGEQFADLCLGMVSVFDYLEKEPEYQGAR